MSVPMFGQTFTLAQMEDAIRVAHSMGQHFPITLTDADVATIISEASDQPLQEVFDGLQRLADWRDWHRDHPV